MLESQRRLSDRPAPAFRSGSSPIQPPAARFLPPLAAGALLAWLVYLITKGQPNFELSVYHATLVQHGLFLALSLVYGGYLAWRRRLPGPTRLDLPIVALIVVYAASSADSVYPRVSAEAALLVVAVVITFYAVHDFAFLSTEALVRLLALAGLAAALIALYHVASDYAGWLRLVDQVEGKVTLSRLLPPTVPRISGVGDHVNILAMAFNLTLPFAVVLALAPVRRFDRALGVAGSVLIVLGLFFTVSRGAWLGAFVATPVFVLLYVLRGREVTAPRVVLPRRLLASGLAVGAIIVVLGGALVASRWDSRPEWLFRSSLSPRYDAVNTGLDIFRDRPVLGAGPYTYSLLYNTYSGKYPIENIHPHNGYVNALDDLGLVGGLVLATGGAIVLLALARAYRPREPRQRLLVAACAAALTTIAVHSFLDTPNTWITSLLPLALVLALSLRLAPPPVAPRLPAAIAQAPRAAILLLAPLLLAGWLLTDPAQHHYKQSLQLLAEGHFTDAASRAQTAADGDSHDAAYQINAGVLDATALLVGLTQLPQTGQDPSPTLGALGEEAVVHLRRAVALEPRSAIGYVNLAIALQLQSELQSLPRAVSFPTTSSDDLMDEAVVSAQAAMVRAPTDGTIAAVAGSVFEAAGRLDAAQAAYSLALSHDAGLVQSPFWSTSPLRMSLRKAALAASTLTPCEKGRVSALYHGFDDDLAALASACQAQVDGAPADARARSDLAVTLYALGRRDEALQQAQDAVRRVPDDAYSRTALAIALAPAGDVAAVRKQLLLGAYLGDPDAALLLYYTYVPPPATNPLRHNLGLPLQPSTPPKEVIARLKAAVPSAAPFVYDNGLQRYTLGVLYYRVRFLRESPSTILIPGDWLAFASPRALLVLDALKATPAK